MACDRHRFQRRILETEKKISYVFSESHRQKISPAATAVNNTSIPMSTEDLNHENDRLKTFGDSWPHAFISPRILAKTGFYYMGPHDQVKCYFCKVIVSSWEMGDNEVIEHSRWSLNCPLLNRRCKLNVSLEPRSELDHLLEDKDPLVLASGPNQLSEENYRQAKLLIIELLKSICQNRIGEKALK